jgi:hypothetical protein
MDMRELKGLELAARHKIAFRDGAWIVPSQTGKGSYRVLLGPEGDSCQCEDFLTRGSEPCKHIHAARLVRQRERGGKAPAIDTDKVPKRPTYRQNWVHYNEAQRIEKHRFQELLADLCRGVEEPPPPKCGRRPHRTSDALFSMALKVYVGFSTRRFACDLNDAHRRGHLSRQVPGMKVCAEWRFPKP